MPDLALPVPELGTHEIAERAALQSISDTFRLLGVDILAMDDLNELRDDFRFIRRMRKSDEFRRAELTKSLLTALGGAMVGMIVSAVSWAISASKHAP